MPTRRRVAAAFRGRRPLRESLNSRGDMRNCFDEIRGKVARWQSRKEAKWQGGKVAMAFLLFACLPPCLFASEAQAPADSLLPIDPAVTVGTLPNGLRYYI